MLTGGNTPKTEHTYHQKQHKNEIMLMTSTN